MIKSDIYSIALPIIAAAISAFFGFIGAKIKAIYQGRINTKEKQDVVLTCVKAVEQLYHDLSGEEKLQKAEQGIREMLEEKSIPISELEMRMLIEAAVSGFNFGFSEKKKEAEEKDAPPQEYTEEGTSA